ncbi:MAG TPA: hypothetical protein VFQ76_17555 [Longimicrobiaceae bacterium]|nr:hypothetical protein [Longimicrobiaceae bacterium]
MNRILSALLLLPLAACGGHDRPPSREAPAAAAPTPTVRPAAYVDSARTIAEDLRRFRVGLEPVAALEGGAASRDALVRGFVEAVESRDTVAAVRMVMSRREFAYLYYPHTPLAAPPREMSPQLAWFLMLQNSEKGITRVFRRLGGAPLGYRGHACDPRPAVQGPTRVWKRCVVRRVTEQGDTTAQALFGGIVERDGRFKFLSYANEF